MVMTNRPDMAQKKLDVLNALIKNPDIGNYALAKLIKSDYRTAKKYREEMIVRMIAVRADVEKRVEEKIREDASIWTRITGILRDIRKK